VAFVLDASAALAVLLANHTLGNIASLTMLLETDTPVVPAVFMPEILNVLVKGERQARGKTTVLDRQLQDISDMAVTTDPDTSLYLVSRTLPLARTHRLSIFDATYLELAMRLSLPLATFDTGLIRGAQAERVALLP
jgi:predicted nucleic acid-binding protein